VKSGEQSATGTHTSCLPVIRNTAIAVLILLMVVFGGGGVSYATSSVLPDFDGVGTLTIHKFWTENFLNLKEGTGKSSDAEMLPGDADQIAGITFQIEKLLVAQNEVARLDSPVDPTFSMMTRITNAQGEIVITGLSKGFYRITELVPHGYEAQSDRFLVKIPLEEGVINEYVWNWDVHIYPKNTAKLAVVTKEIDGDRKVVGLGDAIDWVIDYALSAGMRRTQTINGVPAVVYAQDFYLFDEMDPRLDFVAGSVQMELADRDLHRVTGVTLLAGVDYFESYDPATNVVRWDYSETGVRKLADNQIAHVIVTLKTRVSERAFSTASDAVINNAGIQFTNASGDPFRFTVFEPGTDPGDARVPKAWLGTIDILKVNSATKAPLAGATFKIAPTKDGAKAGTFIKRGGADIEVTTDSTGKARIDIIGAGTYYLVETTTPNGFTPNKSPIEVVVGNTPQSRAVTISIPNTPQPPLLFGLIPKTGEGILFSIMAFALIAGAGAGFIIVVLKRRRQRETIQAEQDGLTDLCSAKGYHYLR